MKCIMYIYIYYVCISSCRYRSLTTHHAVARSPRSWCQRTTRTATGRRHHTLNIVIQRFTVWWSWQVKSSGSSGSKLSPKDMSWWFTKNHNLFLIKSFFAGAKLSSPWWPLEDQPASKGTSWCSCVSFIVFRSFPIYRLSGCAVGRPWTFETEASWGIGASTGEGSIIHDQSCAATWTVVINV